MDRARMEEGQPMLPERSMLPLYSVDPGSPSLAQAAHEHHGGHYHIDANATIYAAIVYAPAVSRLRKGTEWSKTTCLVAAMIALNTVLQLGLLRVMDMYAYRDKQANMIVEAKDDPAKKHLAKTYSSMMTREEREVVQVQADPLCTHSDTGQYHCAPASVAFTEEWQLLDTNGDGIWNISEAMGTDHDAAKTRRTVFFNSIINGLKQRAEWMMSFNQSLYLSQHVLSNSAIPKAYFDYWVGDAVFCTRFDSKACASTVASGLFDGALKNSLAASHKGIADYSSAIRYCNMMTEEGCAQSLPASYLSATTERKRMCGEVSLESAGVMTNPHVPSEIIPVLVPSYTNLTREEDANHKIFLFFVVLIIFLFYASLVDELRDLIKTADFLWSYPGCKDALDRGGEDRGKDHDDDEPRYKIERISRKHRCAVLFVWGLRIIILFMLITFGSAFLLAEDNYMELVMNALALSFITGIDEMLFEVFMESSTQKDIGFEDCDRLKFKGVIPRDGSFTSYFFRKDCWGLLALPIIAVAAVVWNMHYVRQPLIEAMTCSCLQEGGKCAESMVNQGEWWQQYWSSRLPAAIHQIEAMRLQGV